MNKEELIKQCRYYKGQEVNPFSDQDIAWFWDMERVYIEHNGNSIGEGIVYHELKGKRFDGVPYNLLVIMFTSWAKGVDDIESHLQDFYDLVELYLDFVSDRIPKYTVPKG